MTTRRFASAAPSRRPVLALAGVTSLAAAALALPASARPNTHAPAISTWDPRASSVVFGLSGQASGDGSFRALSYNANFSSTSSLLSAQFGLHYLTYREPDEEAPRARGVSAGGVALFTIPLSERHASGLPETSLGIYVGGVPTLLVALERNYLSVPLVLGVGFPWSPSPLVTLTPWGELSPGLNLDTSLEEVSTDEAIEAASDGTLTRDEVEDIAEEALQLRTERGMGKRLGLSTEVHLGRAVDINLHVTIGLGEASALGLGTSLTIRWDDVVPGVTGSRDAGRAPSCEQMRDSLRRCPGMAPPEVRPAGSAARPAPPPAAPPTVQRRRRRPRIRQVQPPPSTPK